MSILPYYCPCDLMPRGSWLGGGGGESQQELPHITLRKPSGSKLPRNLCVGTVSNLEIIPLIAAS